MLAGPSVAVSSQEGQEVCWGQQKSKGHKEGRKAILQCNNQATTLT